MNVHTRSVSRPACVRRNSATNACTSSGVAPDEPQHQIRVGAEPHGRVRAAHLDAALQRLVQVLDLLHDVGQAVGREIAEPVAGAEHRVQRVDRLALVSVLRHRAVSLSSVASAEVLDDPLGRLARRAHAIGDADAVVGGARPRRYPAGSARGSARRDRGGRPRTAASTAAIERPPTLSGRSGSVDDGREMSRARLDQVVVRRVQDVLVADARRRNSARPRGSERRIGPLAAEPRARRHRRLPARHDEPGPVGERAPAFPRR